MKISLFVILSVVLIATISCDSEKKVEQELYDQVMAAHDEVMPEMGSLMKLSKQLRAKSDSLNELGDLSGEEAQEEIQKLIKDLEDAGDGMMRWMREFEPMEEGTPHGEVMQYLREQKRKINKVREDIIDSKDSAEKYLLNTN